MRAGIFLAALLLGGCGGGGGDAATGAAGPGTAPGPGPVTMADAFFTAVQGSLGRDADGEPVAVEGTATPAEGLEPQPLN